MQGILNPRYISPDAMQPSASGGRDLLHTSQTASMVRPKIGGRRRNTRKSKKSKGKKGGFIPSIGETFAAAAGNYAAPIALYGLYRFINGSSRKSKKSKRYRRFTTRRR